MMFKKCVCLSMAILTLGTVLFNTQENAYAGKKDPKVQASVTKALDYIAREQRRQGYWEANGGQYRVAMTALAGVALLAEGSTTTRGKYAPNVRLAVDYLLDMAQPNGLIGFKDDYHYTYGHGFSMLFLSQVYGEEEDKNRRQRLKKVLTQAVKFSAWAQTSKGGWGYVSAKDGGDFDEGSTCITQVQGLRACRNAGIVVPKEIIDKAKVYIQKCMDSSGGIQYSIKGGGPRPPITAAALAAMYNAGEYDESDHINKMIAYCDKNVWPAGNANTFYGHWHYTHYYYSQVMYRDEKKWKRYFSQIGNEIMRKQSGNGSWREGYIGPIYTTAINATILQLDNGYLPIYER